MIIYLIGESGCGKSIIAEELKSRGHNACISDPEKTKELKEKNLITKLIIIYIKSDKEIRIKRMLEMENVALMQTKYSEIYANIIQQTQNDCKRFKAVFCDYVIDGDQPLNELLTNIEKILEYEYLDN